jgi:hypothetical protein
MGFMPAMVAGTQKISDGPLGAGSFRVANDGALVVCENHGKFYEQMIRGNVYFAGTAAAGATVVASASGAVGILYWNKSGGAVLVQDEVARLEIGYISGANVPGFYAWFYLYAGANIGTGAPIATVVTAGNVVNALLGGSPVKAPNVICYIGASTWAGFAYLKATRMSMFTGLAATATTPFQLWEDYDGVLGMPAGMALQLNNNAAQTAVIAATATIIEVPAPGALS